MLAGLCNLCDEYGHGNFDAMKQLVQDVASRCNTIVSADVLERLSEHLRYVKNRFRKEAEVHSSCLELCLSYSFGSCSNDHPHTTSELDSFYSTANAIQEAIQGLPPPHQDTLSKQLDESLARFNCIWDMFFVQSIRPAITNLLFLILNPENL